MLTDFLLTADHRYEGKGGHRRHKVTRKKDDKTISNVVHLGDVTTGQTMLLGKKTYDHTPHDVSGPPETVGRDGSMCFVCRLNCKLFADA